MSFQKYFTTFFHVSILLILIVFGYTNTDENKEGKIPYYSSIYAQSNNSTDIVPSPIDISKTYDIDTSPLVSISKDGNDVYVVWKDYSEEHILFSKSLDGGSTFDDPIYLEDEDNSGDRPNSMYLHLSDDDEKTLYVIWNNINDDIVITKSNDKGETFLQPKTFTLEDDIFKEINAIVEEDKKITDTDVTFRVLGDTIYALLYHITYWSDTPDETPVYLSKSTDGGATFDKPIEVGTHYETSGLEPQIVVSPKNNNTIYIAWMGYDKVLLRTSLDGGTSFTNETEIFGLEFCTEELEVAVVPSDYDPNENYVYATCNLKGIEEREGRVEGTTYNVEYSIVVFAASYDNGKSFGNPVSLDSIDNDEGRDVSNYQLVASENFVYVVWDASNTVSEDDIFQTKSDDYGNTFYDVTAINDDEETTGLGDVDITKNNDLITVFYNELKNVTVRDIITNEEVFLRVLKNDENEPSSSPIINLSNDTTDSREPILKINDNNDAYVAWINGSYASPSHLLFKKIPLLELKD